MVASILCRLGDFFSNAPLRRIINFIQTTTSPMSTTLPSIPVELKDFPPGTVLTIENFTKLALQYRTMKDAQRLRVLSITHFKGKEGVEHEYLEISVLDTLARTSDSEIRLRINREAPTPQNPQQEPGPSSSHEQTPQATQPPAGASSSGKNRSSFIKTFGRAFRRVSQSASQSSKSTKAAPALDTVKNISLEPNDQSPGSKDILRVLNFNNLERPLLLHQLILLAEAIRQIRPSYTLRKFNCYFHSGVMIDLICEEFNESIDNKIDRYHVNHGGEYYWNEFLHVTTYPIHDRDDVLEDILVTYRSNCSIFRKETEEREWKSIQASHQPRNVPDEEKSLLEAEVYKMRRIHQKEY
ncbi:hypothetical protein H0H93_009332 [Arthromyces matolae]|nr:hypothetical protein H0H93_009332 [Arthromyces matolae]